jgi:hypothetical protein
MNVNISNATPTMSTTIPETPTLSLKFLNMAFLPSFYGVSENEY